MNNIDFSGVASYTFQGQTITGSGPLYNGYGTGPNAGNVFGVKTAGNKTFSILDTSISQVSNGIDVSGVPSWQDSGSIRGGRISHCYRGIWLHDYAEGVFISEANVSDCVFGVVVDSGNSNLSNGQTTRCSIGLLISGGPNNAHGSVMGWNSRHNTYNLSVQNVTLGHYFGGCNFIGGQAGADQGYVQIVNSKGIMINGGQIAFANITIDATSQVALRGVIFRGPVNITVAAGGVFDAKQNMVMPGATITLNGSSFSGNN
jgi:hypothetical protein